MVTTTMEWIRIAWRNESRKEQISPKKGSEKAIRKVEATVSFDEGNVIIKKESCTEWKKEWKKLGNIFNKGHKGTSSFKVKYQSNIKKKTLAGLNDDRKTSSIFPVQEKTIETKARKKIRRLVECGKCRLCGEHRETVDHLLSGCKKLLGTEYVKRKNNTFKV